jgi:hypothetical protein
LDGKLPYGRPFGRDASADLTQGQNKYELRTFMKMSNFIPHGYPMVCLLCGTLLQGITWPCFIDDFTAEGSEPPVTAHATPAGACVVELCTDHLLFCRVIPLLSVQSWSFFIFELSGKLAKEERFRSVGDSGFLPRFPAVFTQFEYFVYFMPICPCHLYNRPQFSRRENCVQYLESERYVASGKPDIGSSAC